MKKRNLFAVFILPFLTFGIYGIVWVVKTKNEMNRLGASIPTAWLIIIPFVNIYWIWKYSEGVEHVTGGKLSGIMAFVLEMFLGVIANVIIQSEFNKIAEAPTAAATSGVPASPATQAVESAVPSSNFSNEPNIQPAAVSDGSEVASNTMTSTNVSNDIMPVDSQQPSAPVQPTTTPGIISDVISQPASTSESNSPSEPTPSGQA